MVAQTVKSLRAKQETRVWSPGQEDSPKEGNGLPISVFLPVEFHGPEEPGRLQSMGLQRVRHDWATNT